MPASFLKRHADFFVYCVFGAMATAVNMGSYEILYRIMGLVNVPSVALSWALAVTFAFFTNKYIVLRKGAGQGPCRPARLVLSLPAGKRGAGCHCQVHRSGFDGLEPHAVEVHIQPSCGAVQLSCGTSVHLPLKVMVRRSWSRSRGI